MLKIDEKDALHRWATTFLQTETIVRWNSSWWVFDKTHYVYETEEYVNKLIYDYLLSQHIAPSTFAKTQVRQSVESLAYLRRPAGEQMPFWLIPNQPDPRILINCRNGIYNLDTDELLPHTKDYFTPFVLPYDYDPDAPSPNWDRYTREVLVDDEQIELAHRWLGYSLTGDVSEHKFMLLYGVPGSGKSVFLSLLGHIVGRANTASTTLQSLSSGFGLENLIGKSHCVISEIETGRDAKQLVQNIKAITGDDVMTINRKYQKEISMELPLKFTMACNRLPKLPDASNAVAERMLVLKFDNKFRDTAKQDKKLKDKLIAELPGILNRGIAGLKNLRREGKFNTTSQTLAIVEEFRELSSPHLCFIKECCTISEGVTTTSNLFSAWKNYCLHKGYDHGSEKSFFSGLVSAYHTLTNRVLPRVRSSLALIGDNNCSSRPWGYRGLTLTDYGKKCLGGNSVNRVLGLDDILN